MNVALKNPLQMNVTECLAWCSEEGPAWQLFDGEPTDERLVKNPILVIAILSPGNPAKNWASVRTYANIPSVKEILVTASPEVGAELLQRGPEGTWLESPLSIHSGEIEIKSIGYQRRLINFYWITRLAKAATCT